MTWGSQLLMLGWLERSMMFKLRFMLWAQVCQRHSVRKVHCQISAIESKNKDISVL